MLKKVIKLNAGDFGVIAALVGGAFLLVELIVNIVMLAVRPDTVPTLGAVIVPCLAFMACLFINVFQVPAAFDFYLRFGQTRRRTLGGILGLMSIETVFALLLAWALGQADRLIANAWLAARPEVLEIEFFSVPLWGCALLALAAVLLGLVSGAVIVRFGRKAMAILWVGFMVFITAMNATEWDFIDAFEMGSVPPAAIAVGSVLLLAAVGWSVGSLLRATVKN